MSNATLNYELRTWRYVATSYLTVSGYPSRSQPYLINENLTGAVLGDAKPARIHFEVALALVALWNYRSQTTKYRLVIPNPPEPT